MNGNQVFGNIRNLDYNRRCGNLIFLIVFVDSFEFKRIIILMCRFFKRIFRFVIKDYNTFLIKFLTHLICTFWHSNFLNIIKIISKKFTYAT